MNDAPYRIRLPKPWNAATTCGIDSALNGPVTTHEWQRNFQCPSGLADDSLVQIEIQLTDTSGLLRLECYLNEEALEVESLDESHFLASIDRMSLKSTNRLTIRLISSGQQPAVELPQVAVLIGAPKVEQLSSALSSAAQGQPYRPRPTKQPESRDG